MHLSDSALVKAANEGDEGALEELYVRYREWVVARAFGITRDREDALDVLQETFLYFFKKFPGFELRAKMKTFLYPVVRNLALEKRRKRARLKPLDEAAAEPEAREESAPPVNGGTLAEAVRRLPEAEREVIALRFSDEMSLAEIAEALGAPLGTVKSRLHSALARLREFLRKK